MTNQRLRVAMLVVDANDVSGSSTADPSSLSPVVHPAIQNLIEGLKSREDIEVEVVYGRKSPGPEERRKEGAVQYVPLPYSTLPVPGIGGAYLGRTFALLRYLRESRPDVVHAQGTERESGLVAAICGRPSVLTLHGNFREIARTLNAKPFSYLWTNAKLEGWILPRINGVIAISKYTKDLVGDANREIRVVPNAVKNHYFSIRNEPAPGLVVCLASVDFRKNQISLLKAADRLASSNPAFRLQFWGGAAPSPYLDEFMQELGKRPWATYEGSATTRHVETILASADLLVLPSIEENCPMVILEAMAAGVPVAACAVGGIPELIDNGVTGFLEAPAGIDRLVDQIGGVLKDRPLRASIAANGRAEAKARFAPEAIAESHVNFYRDLAAAGGG